MQLIKRLVKSAAQRVTLNETRSGLPVLIMSKILHFQTTEGFDSPGFPLLIYDVNVVGDGWRDCMRAYVRRMNTQTAPIINPEYS